MTRLPTLTSLWARTPHSMLGCLLGLAAWWGGLAPSHAQPALAAGPSHAGMVAEPEEGKPKATSVAFQGLMGSKAVLVIDGKPPRAMGAGDRQGNVTVLSLKGDLLTVQVDGEPRVLRLGEAQASVAGKARPMGGVQISMVSDASGHFMASGSINGKPTNFMVDTGATAVAMSLADAVKLGVDYQKGKPLQIGTANGTVQGYGVQLHSVRIGDVEVFGVEAVITPQRMPYVLLGNSFLNRFQMRRDADVLVLTRR